MRRWPKFTTIRWVVYCAACHVEMDGEDWPSHYRTAKHRANVRVMALITATPSTATELA